MPLGETYTDEHFVEELGLLFAELGQPRMMGRMLAWLLICEPPDQSSSDLVGALGASKATISTMSRALIGQGLVERVARPGDRRTYFCVKPGASPLLVQSKLDAVHRFATALCRALEHREQRPPDRDDRLREIHDLYAFLETEIPALIERWERQRGSETSAP